MNRWKSLWLPLSLFLFTPIFAGSVLPMNIADLVERSPLIFDGICTEVTFNTVKSLDGKRDMPVIEYTFQVADSLRGDQQQKLTLKQFSKFPDGSTYLFDPDIVGIPKYKKGERYILFMGRTGNTGMSSPIGMKQGVFPIINGQVTSPLGLDTMFQAMETTISKKESRADLDTFKSLIRNLVSGKVVATTLQERSK